MKAVFVALALGVCSVVAPRDALASNSNALLFHVSGSGARTTKVFTTPHQWQLTWHVDCRAAAQKDTLSFTLYDANHKAVDTLSTTAVNLAGGTLYERAGGRMYLALSSSCTWSVVADRTPAVAQDSRSRTV